MRPAILVALSVLAAAPASAQQFRVDRFAPAPNGEDATLIPHPATLGHLRPAAGLILDYAYAPLSANDGTAAGPIVEHRVIGWVLGALGITDRAEVHVRVPFVFAAGGGSVGSFAPADGFSMGDGALGGSVRIVGEGDRQGAWLGTTAELLVPMGGDYAPNAWASDTEVGARGMVTFAYGTPVITPIVSLGAAYRPERVNSGNAISGSELEFALGFLFDATTWLDVMVELVGASLFRLVDDPAASVNTPTFFSTRGTPLEVMLGGRVHAGGGFLIQASFAVGLTSAVGVPTVRAMAGLQWGLPAAAPSDRDGDGIPDDDDQCADEREDLDRHDDDDGCPDLDDDGDGVLDGSDRCPREQEDVDGFHDDDGCPDPDDDDDGVLGDEDACPREPGPGVTRGCPQMIRVVGDRIELQYELSFVPNGFDLMPGTGATMDEIRAVMEVDRRMRIRIAVAGRGEGSGRGRHATPGADLGPQRAQAMAAWLEDHGIDAARIETAGLPPEGPPSIEITILDRAPRGASE